MGLDQVSIRLTRWMPDAHHQRIKFDIIAYHPSGANHYGFVRTFALVNGEVLRTKTRKEIAAILRVEHRAAWERYHRYAE